MEKVKKTSITFKRLGCGASRTYVLRSIAGKPTIRFTNLMARNIILRVNDRLEEEQLQLLCEDENFSVRVTG